MMWDANYEGAPSPDQYRLLDELVGLRQREYALLDQLQCTSLSGGEWGYRCLKFRGHDSVHNSDPRIFTGTYGIFGSCGFGVTWSEEVVL